MITVKNLMSIERILLEIYTKHRFELEFNSAYKLYNYLRVIGRITNYSFQIQDEIGVGSQASKSPRAITGEMIKETCIPIKVDRLGNVIEINGSPL